VYTYHKETGDLIKQGNAIVVDLEIRLAPVF